MCMYTDDESRNFIEIRGRGLKIISFPALDNDLMWKYDILIWKAALLGMKYRCSNLHWQDCPSSMYPSLQMQL